MGNCWSCMKEAMCGRCREEETNVVSSAPERTMEPLTVGVVRADLQTKQNPVESPVASTSKPQTSASAPSESLVGADLQTKQEPPTVRVVEADLQTKQNPVQSTVASTSMPQKEVFLSHSGVQKSFVRQLYRDLTREGVSCFFDQNRESLPLAEKWAPRIFEAAETCKVAVLVLSMDFIQSRWPMLELCAFLKAKKSDKNSNLKILPLFFKISPGDLKDLTSDIQDILDWTRLEISEETRIEWKEALREVRKINGLQFKEGEDEVSFRDEIIKEIRTLLPPSPIVSSMPGSVGLAEGQEEVTLPLAQPTYPAWAVGLEEPVKQITEMLELGKAKERAEAIVIYGFGGIGKTTLANAVLANLKLEGHRYTKININEDPKKNDLKSMQQQLLKDVFPEYQDGRKITLRDCEEGRHHLTRALQSQSDKPVFICIDNALRAEDLVELLAEDLGGLSQCSRILLTARDLRVTDLFEERGLSRRSYLVKTLADEDGEKIFCNDLDKLQQIKDDVKKVLQICGGIPLALKIVGSQLRKQKYRADNCSEILQALEKGEEIKQEQLSERLVNFVYNRLETSTKEAFLDICTVLYTKNFHRRWIEYIVGVNEVATLEEAALITAVPFANSFDYMRQRRVYWEGEEELIVHDVILAKGRSMTKGTRIVGDAQSLCRAVEDQKVLESIKGVLIPYDDEPEYMLEESQLSCMSNSLRVFCLGHRMSVRGLCSNTFQELRYLVISGDIPCLPVNLEALPRLAFYAGPIFKEGFSINKMSKSLRCLCAQAQSNRDECATSEESNPIQTVQNSSLQELNLFRLKNMPILLEVIHQFIELKVLVVVGWDEMEELPAQVCQLRSLNKLIMWGWKSLKRLPESFSNLTGLTHLDLDFCDRLEGLCSSFGELTGLRFLSLRRCKMLTELPDSFGQLIALKYLDLEQCISLTILPDNFGELTALEYLNLSYCYELKGMPSNFLQLTNLEVLEWYGCEELPLSLEELRSLTIRG